MTAGVVAICFALLVWCGGSWDYLGPPVNYFGCGTDRPDGISAEGLVGAYTTVDGARLELHADGTLTAVALTTEFMNGRIDVSGPGNWTLRPEGSQFGDLDLMLTGEGAGHAAHLRISGTREEPWLYWYNGDPDGCDLYRFNRTT